MKKLLCSLLLGLSLSGVTLAAIDTYEFKNEDERQRFRQLTEELRCPKCQNQNIADSNAPIAMDLRREIYRMFAEGKSNAEIVEFLVDRYGDFVLYNPPLSSKTLLLWYGPAGLLGLGVLTLGVIVWRRRRGAASAAATDLSAEERERLAQLLDNQLLDNQPLDKK